MIGISEEQDLLRIHVLNEFTVDDFREFENAVTGELKSNPKIRLLMDLSNMSGFTVDMAWEDVKFTRAHSQAFRRIAIVCSSDWNRWLGWVTAAFTDAETQIFDDLDEAEGWLAAA
jgi:hypothetical protein